ncbi:MAG TPA: ParB N-terminal domain-containing protein [Clostridium sp.]
MAKAKITIIGEIEKFKVQGDGTVNIIIKADTSAAVPNGLKELGASTYNITVSKKMWKKVLDKLQGNRIMFTGEPKAAVTVKGVPFTLVNCFDISVIEQKVKDNQTEPKKDVPPKPVQPLKNEAQEMKHLNTKTDSPGTPTKSKKLQVDDPDTKALRHWRKNHKDVQDVKVADLVLTEEEHLKGFNTSNFMSFNSLRRQGKPIIVRPLDNGKFSLVVGYRTYIIAKILNFETIPAIITDSTRQCIIEEAWKQIKIKEDEVVQDNKLSDN